MIWRGHRLLAVVQTTLILTTSLLLFTPAAAFACSCAPSPSPCGLLGAAGVIFIGTPVAVEPLDARDGVGRVRFHFDVERPIKSIDAKTADVDTLDNTAACGYPFELGVKYLVYASRGTGSLLVSFCSRTGPLADRRDDLELLSETAGGGIVRPRLFGVIDRQQLRLDGFYMHYGDGGGVPDVPIRVKDGAQVREERTDAGGRFSIIGLAPGRHVVEPQLPNRYSPLFDREIVANVDSCSGQVFIFVATVPLRGTVRPAGATAGGRQVMLRLAQIGSDGGVAFERSTLAFTEPDGTWKVPGLPAGRYILGVSAFDPPTPHTPYPTTWYPDASQPEQATVLDVSDDRQISVDFHLPLPLAESTVTDLTLEADGTPIPNVSVALYDIEQHGPFPEVVGHAISDDHGRFSITALRGRHYRIQGTVLRPDGAQSDLIEIWDEQAQHGVRVIFKARR